MPFYHDELQQLKTSDYIFGSTFFSILVVHEIIIILNNQRMYIALNTDVNARLWNTNNSTAGAVKVKANLQEQLSDRLHLTKQVLLKCKRFKH